jgi:hypothetical protein
MSTGLQALVELAVEEVAAKVDIRTVGVSQFPDGGVQVRIGGLEFFRRAEDGGRAAVLKDVFTWLSARAELYTPQQAQEAAAELEADAAERTQRLIEELTEGGLSEAGKVYEAAVQQVQARIRGLWNELTESGTPPDKLTFWKQAQEHLPGVSLEDVATFLSLDP